MDTQNLKAFLLVAETGSFSRAAEQLHLTQPAVSKRIAQLEQHLDSALFDRIGHNIRMTEAGQTLLPHAKAVQQALQGAEQSVRDLAGDVAGELRLATSHHIGLHRLPPLLSHFSKAFPAVQIDIEFMDSEQACELITQGKVELAVVTLAPVTETSIIALPIWQDPLDFMVRVGDELLQQPTLDLRALSTHPAVLPGLNTYTGQIVKSLFDQHELQLQVSMATNYLETVRMMASVGLGWTVLPRSMCDNSLATLQVSEAYIERTLGVVYHRDRSLPRAARAFMDALISFGDSNAGSIKPASVASCA
ncbi:MAG: LysR family transcriptional regulator [Gammaproteobacteria bacterium]|nr:MAG: LysR family transcriptional regulator [Gammaproteobacteria bacterium]RLA61641.1 MAG: LysR family transcriptional regulator [Gammaproteobacteria bacterium]